MNDPSCRKTGQISPPGQCRFDVRIGPPASSRRGLVTRPRVMCEARGGKDHCYRGNAGAKGEGTERPVSSAPGVEFDRSVSCGSLHRKFLGVRGYRERRHRESRGQEAFPG